MNNYHEECLFSQLRFLKSSGHWICLVVHPQLKSRVIEYKTAYDECHTIEVGSKIFFGKRILRTLQLYFLIKKRKITSVIFNTASSKKEIIALGFLFRGKKLFGTIHNLKKLGNSLSQQLISKNVKHYFVLNDALLERAAQIKPSYFFESFYPIFFYDYPTGNLIKGPREKWVVIPGKIEPKRRDYFHALEAMQSIHPSKRPKLILLGRLNINNHDHQKLNEEIDHRNLRNDVIIFEEFVENSLFHSYIKSSDFIFTPFKGLGMDYFHNRIMGAFNLSFAYDKPIICPEVLKSHEDLKSLGVFYQNTKQLGQILATDWPQKNTMDDHKQKLKWDFTIQSEKYNAFLEKDKGQ